MYLSIKTIRGELKKMENEKLKTGTTTVGVLGKDCVILAADKRATAGNFIADRNVDKIFKISDNTALTTAGSVSDVQLLVKLLKAEIKLKEIRSGRKLLAKEGANMLASMNYSGIRTRGSIAHFLFAGYDATGNHLFDLYPDGSVMEVSEQTGFVASGSGSVIAYGLLEDAWKKDMSEEEVTNLAVRSVAAAMRRDSASGEGINIFRISSKGVEKLDTKLVNNKLE